MVESARMVLLFHPVNISCRYGGGTGSKVRFWPIVQSPWNNDIGVVT